MHDLTKFDLSDMTRCGSEVRNAGRGCASMEQAARAIVRDLYERLGTDGGDPACALVRLFVTLDYRELDDELQAFGRTLMAGHTLEATTKCLTLLATAGAEPDWNDRRQSVGHKTIPLPSEHVVHEIPMIAQLIRQLGLEVATVLNPDPALVLELDRRTCNVFHVPDAKGSPYIPAQDFVERQDIRPVLGIGGGFPTGNIFALLMFTTVAVPRRTAELFRTAALNAKLALLPFVQGPIFDVPSTNRETEGGD